jgi:hypothetical protein
MPSTHEKAYNSWIHGQHVKVVCPKNKNIEAVKYEIINQKPKLV